MANTTITPEYFKNQMNWFELSNLLDVLGDKHINEAENTRLIMYSIFQSQSPKKIKVTDVMKFPWDTTEEVIDTKKLMDKNDAQSIIKNLGNGKKAVQ